jgi:uncharacterized protein (TIGR02145 family)
MNSRYALLLLYLIAIINFSFSQTVTIGTQTWMTKNLDVSTFRNGDPIPEAKTNIEWKKAGENKQPAWCYYDNDPSKDIKYGKLYNFYAVKDSRGLAPEGFHIPSDSEWTILENYLGGNSIAGKKMKNSIGWTQNGNGSNESSFNGRPGGSREHDGVFTGFGENAHWWSSTEKDPNNTLHPLPWSSYLIYGYDTFFRRGIHKEHGLSVRCLMD